MPGTTPEQQRWLENLEEQFGSRGAVDRKAGLQPGVFWRQAENGKLGIKPILKIAKATGEPATAILRRMGKTDLADLIEETFGEPQVLAPRVREFAELEKQLPSDVVQAALVSLRAYRDAWLQRSDEDNAPSGHPVAARRKRATRGALKK